MAAVGAAQVQGILRVDVSSDPKAGEGARGPLQRVSIPGEAAAYIEALDFRLCPGLGLRVAQQQLAWRHLGLRLVRARQMAGPPHPRLERVALPRHERGAAEIANLAQYFH